MNRFVKGLSLLLIIMGVTLFSACSKEKDEPKDSLSGTTWSRAYSDEIEHIDFISESEVEYYYTKNGALSSSVGSGSYTKAGSVITFHNLHLTHDFVRTNIIRAEIAGKTMTITYTFGSNDYEYTSKFRQDN